MLICDYKPLSLVDMQVMQSDTQMLYLIVYQVSLQRVEIYVVIQFIIYKSHLFASQRGAFRYSLLH